MEQEIIERLMSKLNVNHEEAERLTALAVAELKKRVNTSGAYFDEVSMVNFLVSKAVEIAESSVVTVTLTTAAPRQAAGRVYRKNDARSNEFIQSVLNHITYSLSRYFGQKMTFTTITSELIRSEVGEAISLAIRKENKEGMMSKEDFKSYVFTAARLNIANKALGEESGSMVSIGIIRDRNSQAVIDAKKQAMKIAVHTGDMEEEELEGIMGSGDIGLLDSRQSPLSAAVLQEVFESVDGLNIVSSFLNGKTKGELGMTKLQREVEIERAINVLEQKVGDIDEKTIRLILSIWQSENFDKLLAAS